MLDAIRFVQGAVAKKDLIPELTHFLIKEGKIFGYNGAISICHPIELDLAISPNAATFFRAVSNCKDTIQLHVTPTGKLSVRSGPFRAMVECLPIESFPVIPPSGSRIPIDPEFPLVEILKRLNPFIAQDASRPWARSLLFRGQSVYATNNIILIQQWAGVPFPVEVGIPQMAVNELIRINETPEYIQVDDNSCTFHYQGGGWLRTAVGGTGWPAIDSIFAKDFKPAPIHKGLFDAMEELLPFTDSDSNAIYLRPGGVHTSPVDDIGASLAIEDFDNSGAFNAKQFLLLKKLIKNIDLSPAPSPCLFINDELKLRGIIVGMKY